jgi:2-polyprenyl-3-methyl-5-hydroxy-6-metoxy-1,4-benzoquinol methylase
LYAELAAISGVIGFGYYLERTGYMKRRELPDSLSVDANFIEERVVVDQTEYPDGLNGNFLCSDGCSVLKTYSGPCGRFENSELRDIAASLPGTVKMIDEHVSLEGKHVLDVGAGTGLFLAPMVEATGEHGTYHAIEISEVFVKFVEERISNGSCCQKKRAAVSKCSDKSTLRPKKSADVAIIVDVYHHFEYPITFMRDLHKTLAPGGKVVMIDFHR